MAQDDWEPASVIGRLRETMAGLRERLIDDTTDVVSEMRRAPTGVQTIPKRTPAVRHSRSRDAVLV
jgi:hypothetical protein